MRKYFGTILLAVGFLCFSLPDFGQQFVHPGMNQSADDLAYMKKLVDSGQEPWKSAFDKLVATTDTTFIAKPYAHVMRGPYAKPNIGGDELSKSANLSYNCALLWYLTGDRNYANTAIRCFDSWSATLWDFDYNDAKLLAGWTGHAFINAAEILRYTNAGWKKESIDRFTEMLMTVYYPLLRYYYPTANGNWDGAIIHSLMAIGIFTDNRSLFNNAVDHFLHGPVNGSIFKYIYPSGQCQESARDQAHVQLGLGEFAGAAQVAFTQGVDLFSIGENRIGRGFEYTAGYLLGHTPHCYCEISPRAMRLGGEFEYVYRHYKAKGVEFPFITKAADSMRVMVPAKTLAAVRASFGNNTLPVKTFIGDPVTYISGADHDIPSIPENAIWVQPGQSVQKALDKAAGSGHWVVLAKGLHTLDSALKLPNNIVLSGVGSESVLFLKPEGGRDMIVNGAEDLHDITLRNFVVEGALQPKPGDDPNSSRSFRNKGARGGIIFRSQKVNLMHDLRFINLTVRNCTYNGVFISGAKNLLFSYCNFDENGAGVIPGPKLQHNLLLTHCAGIVIKNSRLDTSPEGSGIYLDKCRDISVDQNELARNALNGITIIGSENIVVKNNHVEGNDSSGIHFPFFYNKSNKVTISGNNVQFNGGYAVQCERVQGLQLMKNSWVGNGPFKGIISIKNQVLIDGKETDLKN